MHLLEESKISPLNFNFVIICIIHKMLVLLKNHLNYIKDSIFKCFFKEYDKILSFFFFFKFFTTCNDGKFKPWRRKYAKDIRNVSTVK